MAIQSKDKEEQIVVTLALIQRALEELNGRVTSHHTVLFGNGNPQESIVWAIRVLSQSIEKLESTLESMAKQNEEDKEVINSLKLRTENLSWSQWTKKFIMHWFPGVIVTLVIIIIFFKPLSALISAIAKLL